MNENIDLRKILKDCPKGWPLYSSVTGHVKFHSVDEKYVHIESQGWISRLTPDGRVEDCPEGECIIFPSREQRDWSKFTTQRFDFKTLKPGSKVLVRLGDDSEWQCAIFSRMNDREFLYKFYVSRARFSECVPYNDDTKHLEATKDKAPEFYRHWED
ncbi:MAG: hypothetical protein SO142_03240 [Prevotella sp.]|nr:hypothetical protein [Prevotella sp.]